MHSSRALLFRLLLTLSLLGFAAVSSAHDHELTPPAADALCAICVYSGGALAGPGPAGPALADPQRHIQPESPGIPSAGAPPRATTRIRGPPSIG